MDFAKAFVLDVTSICLQRGSLAINLLTFVLLVLFWVCILCGAHVELPTTLFRAMKDSTKWVRGDHHYSVAFKVKRSILGDTNKASTSFSMSECLVSASFNTLLT